MILYSFCGGYADQIATNSSWTDNHIRKLWGDRKTIKLIYPPCDTRDIIDKISLDSDVCPRQNIMISFAQFRPEKNQ